MTSDVRSPFGRVLTAMVTPMRHDGSVDHAAAERLVEHLLATRHDGIVVNGTTGESPTLTADESIEMVRLVKQVAGDRAKIVAGVGSNDTAHAVDMARRSAEVGADAALLVSPYYNKPTQPGLIAHCQRVADATDLPVMLYDIPGRTGIPFTESTLRTLAEHPRIIAVKDAKADFWEASRLMTETGLMWFSGNDQDNLTFLTLGAVGVVSVVGHVAGHRYAAMVAAVDASDIPAARAIHRELEPAVTAIMTTSQGAIMAKAALVEIGVLDSAAVRLPLVQGPPEHVELLREGLRGSGLL